MMMLPQREFDFARLVGVMNRPVPTADISPSAAACVSRTIIEHGKKHVESKY
jgi:hypothetical protein